ncbi:2375_t:CDS:2, partial [Ambispora gerdemannii]
MPSTTSLDPEFQNWNGRNRKMTHGIISHNVESNTSNLDIYQEESETRSFASSVTPTSPAETISLKEKEENEFLDSKHRETVRKEIIKNIKKSRDQELLSTPENTIPKISISLNKNVPISEAEKSLLYKDLNIQDTKLSSSESKSSIIFSSNQKQSAISSKIKISYNQKDEQGLICELSTFINEKSLLNSIPDRQILENMLDGDDSTSGSASHL